MMPNDRLPEITEEFSLQVTRHDGSVDSASYDGDGTSLRNAKKLTEDAKRVAGVDNKLDQLAMEVLNGRRNNQA